MNLNDYNWSIYFYSYKFSALRRPVIRTKLIRMISANASVNIFCKTFFDELKNEFEICKQHTLTIVKSSNLL